MKLELELPSHIAEVFKHVSRTGLQPTWKIQMGADYTDLSMSWRQNTGKIRTRKSGETSKARPGNPGALTVRLSDQGAPAQIPENGTPATGSSAGHTVSGTGKRKSFSTKLRNRRRLTEYNARKRAALTPIQEDMETGPPESAGPGNPGAHSPTQRRTEKAGQGNPGALSPSPTTQRAGPGNPGALSSLQPRVGQGNPGAPKEGEKEEKEKQKAQETTPKKVSLFTGITQKLTPYLKRKQRQVPAPRNYPLRRHDNTPPAASQQTRQTSPTTTRPDTQTKISSPSNRTKTTQAAVSENTSQPQTAVKTLRAPGTPISEQTAQPLIAKTTRQPSLTTTHPDATKTTRQPRSTTNHPETTYTVSTQQLSPIKTIGDNTAHSAASNDIVSIYNQSTLYDSQSDIDSYLDSDTDSDTNFLSESTDPENTIDNIPPPHREEIFSRYDNKEHDPPTTWYYGYKESEYTACVDKQNEHLIDTVYYKAISIYCKQITEATLKKQYPDRDQDLRMLYMCRWKYDDLQAEHQQMIHKIQH